MNKIARINDPIIVIIPVNRDIFKSKPYPRSHAICL